MISTLVAQYFLGIIWLLNRIFMEKLFELERKLSFHMELRTSYVLEHFGNTSSSMSFHCQFVSGPQPYTVTASALNE